VVYLFQQVQEGVIELPGVPVRVPTTSQRLPQPAPATDASGSVEVWFTDPFSAVSRPGPDVHLIEAIGAAQQSIDIAIYNLTIEAMGDALIAAHRRGVVVRLVMESEAMERPVPQRLLREGIPIQGDNREGLMHNKFVVIDGQEVWSGSLNFSPGAVNNDFNNLVRLRSQRMAQNYSVAFNEMFVEGLFGPSKRANTPYPRVDIDGTLVEVYFSPDDGVASYVADAVGAANTSIDFMVYSFTSDEIGAAVRERAADGVQVRGVFDASQRQSNIGTEFDPMQAAGLDVRLDGISGLLHHKVIIIDGRTVITGSYNFSANAERNNDENLLIIHSPEIGARYLQEFQIVYDNGR
jgi:phosphatidylserine/phosphatidylglycerophosphate/cardiolipin synthase-like enzyme